jgi:Type IV secretion-system coupling protein DNA-binding domain
MHTLREELNIRPEIAFFGSVLVRDGIKHFGILEDDRRRHMYILGKTGMGKSTMMTNLILQDIENGHGCAFLDPHGDAIEYILERIPEHRIQDVVYFNPSDTEYPIGFNIFEQVKDEEMFLLAAGMMAVFKRIWEGSWSARMEYILNNTLLALLETPGNTLLDVVRMLQDDDFRKEVVSNIIDPVVKNFWIKEFAAFNDKYRTEAIAPILNKIGQFFSTSLIRNILGQQKSTINLRDIMDNRKILLINLTKGKLGDDNSALMGSLMITRMQLAAMSRVDIPEADRKDFYMYVDEFQNFVTDSFAVILSEARKYRLSLILAHQYIAQLTESENLKVRNAIFGNAGTILSYRVGADDAEYLEKEFAPVFLASDLVKLNKFQMALKMPINGRASNAFLATALSPIYPDKTGNFDIAVEYSRKTFGRPVEMVTAEIKERLDPDLEGLNDRQKKKKLGANLAMKTREESKERFQTKQSQKFQEQEIIQSPVTTSNNMQDRLSALKNRSL